MTFILVWFILPFAIFILFYSHQSLGVFSSIFIPLSYITSYSIFHLGQYINDKVNFDCRLVYLFFIILFLINFVLISYQVKPYTPEFYSEDFPEYLKDISYEFRYYPRNENYREVFNRINDIDEPQIGVITLEMEGRRSEFNLGYWPFWGISDRSGYEFKELIIEKNIQKAKYENVIPSDTYYYVAQYPMDDFGRLKSGSDIVVFARPERILKYEHREGYNKIKDKFEDGWNVIESFNHPYDNYNLTFYGRE